MRWTEGWAEGATRTEGERKGGIKGQGGMETSKMFQTWKVPTWAQFIPLPQTRSQRFRQVYSCVPLTICSCTRWGQQIPLNVKRCGVAGVNYQVIALWRHTPSFSLWLFLWGFWTLGRLFFRQQKMKQVWSLQTERLSLRQTDRNI